MSTQRLLLDSYLKTLKLPTMRAEYKAIARKCSQTDAPYEDFLQQLAELEVQRRTAAAIERRLKQAEFPMVKEMSSYRFADVPKLNKKYVLDLARCQFIKLEKNIRQCDLIIVDELGYIPLDRMGAEHLFGFFSQCYEQTSLIVTTNLPFADWPQVFAEDERLAGALLDRLTHHVHILEIIADSYRLKTSMDKGRKKQK